MIRFQPIPKGGKVMTNMKTGKQKPVPPKSKPKEK